MCMCVYESQCFPDFKALHIGAAGTVASSDFARHWEENMHVFPWGLITNQEFKFLLGRRGHSWRSPSHSKHIACPFCVSAVPVFSLSNFLYPRGIHRAFAQILLCIILAWSHQQGSDNTCNNMHMHWYICTKYLSWAQTEWKCLFRRWAAVKVWPLQNRRPITQPDNTIHTVSDRSLQHCC